MAPILPSSMYMLQQDHNYAGSNKLLSPIPLYATRNVLSNGSRFDPHLHQAMICTRTTEPRRRYRVEGFQRDMF